MELLAGLTARAAVAACDRFGIARNTGTTFDVFFGLQVANFDVSLLQSPPNGLDYVDIVVFVLSVHRQLVRVSILLRMSD